ncbi:hypothetical protein FDB52_17130 [Clostridium botulinum]|nr:hypothetical protein [Clostridium botulinum]NFN50193.1 hypothetical protein [Clostridium botulinum]
MSNIHNLEIDVDLKENLIITATCKQLDDLNLKFNVWNNGEMVDLSEYKCRLKAFKQDQIPLIQNTSININNNVVNIIADEQFTTTSGTVKVELQFINKNTGKKKSTFNIIFKVMQSVLEVERSISKATCTLLKEIDYKLDQIEDIKLDIIEAVKVKNDLNTSRTDANNMNNTLKTTTTSADNKKKEVETAINNASSKIKEVQDSTATANAAKQSVDSSIIQANSSKQALDTSKTNADNKKKEVDAAIIVADEKIEIIKKLDPENVVEDVKKLKEQVLENTYTKLETDSTLTKLDNCENSFVHNMQIKGRTLQNELGVGCINTIIKKGTNLVINRTLKPNTTYTFVSTIVDSSYSDDTNGLIWTLRINNVAQYNGFGIENKNLITKFTTGSEETIFGSIGMHDNNSNNSHATYSGMLLEGDWTNKEIPSYFEGIKSVGEAEDNKISILTTSKNLYNGVLPINITANKAGDSPYYKVNIIPKDGITITAIDSNNTIINTSSIAMRFIFEDNTNKYKPFYEKVFIPNSEFNNKKITQINVFWNNQNITDITISKVIIGLGDCRNTILDYEPYKQDKTEILLPSPHCGLPSGVSDIAGPEKNERIKNVDKVVLNGSENWIKQGQEFENTALFSILFPVANTAWSPFNNLISDRFINGDTWSDDKECLSIDSAKGLNLRILKSRLLEYGFINGNIATYIPALKKWLQANPTTVYYQLATPVVERLNIKDTLQSFENGYIQLDNAITPTAQLEYSTNIPSAIGGLTKVVDKLVDDVTNVEITISDMDAEIGEARKGKTTLEERLEEDRTNILNTTNKLDKSKCNREAVVVDPALDLLTFPPGHFRVEGKISTLQNYPINRDWIHATVEISGFMNDDTHQGYKVIIFTTNDGDVYMNTQTWDAGKWSGWKQIATIDDTGWIDLPLLNGATTTSDKAIYRRIGKMVYFKGVVNNITTDNFIFGNLPIGFRPNSKSGGPNIPVPLFLPGEDTPSRLIVYKNGNLQLSRRNDKNTCYLDGVTFVLD